MMNSPRQLRVFLCHATADKPAVRDLFERLKSEEWIDPWLDATKILPGQHWTSVIRQALAEADSVVILISNHSTNREGFVQREMNYAWDISLEKPRSVIYLIPLRLEDCEVPFDLRERQWADYFGDRKEETYLALLQSLRLRYDQKLRLEAEEKSRQERLKLEAERIAREKAEKESAEKERQEAEEKEQQRIAKEKADREAAEKEAAQKARLEAEEKEQQRIAKEKADREAAEKARLIAEEKERKRIAREKAERETAEKTAREKTEKEAAELVTLLYGKFNKAIQLERSGYLDEALKIYYEIKSADSKYPNIENKIQTVEKAILKAKEEEKQRIAREKAEREKARLIANLLYEKTNQAINFEKSGSLDAAFKVYSEIQSIDPNYPNIEKKILEIESLIKLREKASIEAERLKREEERPQIVKKITQSIYWFGSFVLVISGVALISSINIPSQTIKPTPNVNRSQVVITSTYSGIVEPSVTITPSPTSTPSIPTSTIAPIVPTPIRYLSTEIVDTKGVTMRLVPAGEFIMGGDKYADEKPVQPITLNDFYIDKYEVTNSAYQLCVNDGVCSPPEMASSSTRLSYYGNSEFSNYPVIYLNWYMAEAYCHWREGRLPTNAEWEKAARGVDGRTFPWGEDISCTYANYKSGCVGDITEIGSYPDGVSYYGLYDVIGNVAEWVNDGHDYQAFVYNPWDVQVFNAVRGTKGGSWSFGSILARASYRNWLSPVAANYDVGIRCAKDIEP